MNKNILAGKLFSPLSRYGKHFLNVMSQGNIDKRILSSIISALLITFNYFQ